MSRIDQITLRKPMFGNNRSKALNITKRRWNLNLQNVTLTDANGNKIKVRTTAKTIRTLKKHNKIPSYYKVK